MLLREGLDLATLAEKIKGEGERAIWGNTDGKPVAMVIGATSKWQSDGRNTLLIHG